MGYVLQITDSTGGGAGRATIRLHQGLLDIGVDSRVLCRENTANAEGAHALRDTRKDTPGGEDAAAKWAAIDRQVAINNRTAISNTIISLGYPGYDISALPIVRNAEILHLHWTPRLLSVRGIEQLLQLGKPTFWTQHDRWPTTPGYHFQASEADFAAPGQSTTHLFDDYQLPRLLLEDKRRSFDYPNLHIVCLTDQLSDLYRTSSIFTDRAVSTVANGIETDTFRSFADAERQQARNQLGIDQDTIVLLMLSQHGQEKRKGYAHVAEALRAADDLPDLAQARDEDRLLIATIGAGGSADAFPGLRTLPISTISDDDKLVSVMNACDALVMPSEQESFSLAVLEALACGLPVISFGHGGMPETEIVTGQNGILIEGRPNPQSLAKAINQFCSDGFDRAGCRARARQTAEKFDVETVARAMLDIYRKAPEADLTTDQTTEFAAVSTPNVQHAARFDYAPSDWLGRQMAEPAIAKLLAAAGPKPKPPAKAGSAGGADSAQGDDADGVTDLLPILRLSTLAERRSDGAIQIAAQGDEGHAVFGPYLRPEPGDYEITARIQTARLPLGALFQKKKSQLIEASLNADRILTHERWKASALSAQDKTLTLAFTLAPEDCDGFASGIEFRLWTDGSTPITLTSARMTRRDG